MYSKYNEEKAGKSLGKFLVKVQHKDQNIHCLQKKCIQLNILKMKGKIMFIKLKIKFPL